ncbi:MAG: rhodanese family protein [Burkholderiales bacterium]|nr:rhodanese family protein [Burkholderiales bacterium]
MSEVLYISTQELQDLYQTSNVVIYDIREADEYAREHITGSQNVPISKFDANSFNDLKDKVVVFHCQSGNRTKMNENKLKQINCEKIYVLKNGLTEWKNQGCAVTINNKAPLPIMRQVQIVSGLLVLVGVIAGFLITPSFFLFSGLIGAGLIFAGVSGYCGMANLLMLLPYNKTNKCNNTCQ